MMKIKKNFKNLILVAIVIFGSVSMVWGQRNVESAVSGSLTLTPPFDEENIQMQKDFAVGMSLFAQKNFELSIDYFTRALTGDEQNDTVRFFLGLAFYQAGYTVNAIAEWENIIKLRGVDPILKTRIDAAYISQLKEQTLSQNPLSQELVLHSEMSLLGVFQEVKNERTSILLPTVVKAIGKRQTLVMDSKNAVLLVLDSDGKIEKELIGFLEQSTVLSLVLDGPYDLAELQDGNYVVSDFSGNNLFWIDSDGNQQLQLDQATIGFNDQLRGPLGVDIDSDGNILVVDSVLGEIKTYNNRGRLIGRFGSRGTSKGQLNAPTDVGYDFRTDKTMVVDQGKKSILQFDRNGFFDREFVDNQLKSPSRLLVHPYVHNELLVLDNDQVFRLNLNTSSFEKLIEPGQPRTRHFLSFDVDEDDGMLLVGNVFSSSIQRYTRPSTLYSNLRLLFEGVELKDFPNVVVRLSVKDALGLPKRNLNKRNFFL